MTTDWRGFAEELLRAVEDARRDFDNLDTPCLEFDVAGKTAKVVDAKDGGDFYVELWDTREIFDELLEAWRRRMYVAEIEDARGAVAA